MNQKINIGIHLLLFVVLVIMAFVTGGYGSDGDSITHYFFAKGAWQNPMYLFDQWAKPFFTLFASPFAQFGFIGIKVFNITCGVLSSYFATQVARVLGKKWFWLIPVFAFATPAYYSYLFSGLTEPFSGLVLILSIYLCLTKRVSAGFILASFLAFCRTEAQVYLFLFALFAISNGQLKKVPLLLVSYVVYTVVGYFFTHDLFWVFSHPYNSTGSVYGSGTWWHYLSEMRNENTIVPLLLAALGLLASIGRITEKVYDWRNELWLVHGIFFSTLIGHSLMWYLGVFGSAGMPRTILPVYPLLWIILIDGLGFLERITVRYVIKFKTLIAILLCCQLVIAVSGPYAGYYFMNNLPPNTDQQFIKAEVVPFVKAAFPKAEQFVIEHPFLGLALDINFIDYKQRIVWTEYSKNNWNPNWIWIYESRITEQQSGVTVQQIEEDGKLKLLRKFVSSEGWEYYVYVQADRNLTSQF